MNFIKKLAAGLLIICICFFSLVGAQETKDNKMENKSYANQ